MRDSLEASPQTDSTWSDRYETSDSIVVYTRSAEGTDILEVRAEGIADVPPDIVYRVVLRQETYKYTSKYVAEFRTVQTENDNVWYIYQRLSIPFLSDRDYTLRYEAVYDSVSGRSSLFWTVANNKGPPPLENVVRVQVSKGAIEMIPIGDGTKTRISCTILTDPGGSVPNWLVNIGNRRTVPDVIREIREGSRREYDSKKEDEH